MDRRRALVGQRKRLPIYGDFRFIDEWNAGDGVPDANHFFISGDTTLLSIDLDGTIHFSVPPPSTYVGFRVNNIPQDHSLIECEINVHTTIAHGIRVLAGGTNNTGNQITINGNSLNVLQGSDALTTIKQTAAFPYDTYHTICVGLDKEKNDNRVYLDGRFISMVDNKNLSSISAGSTWICSQRGSVNIRRLTVFA